MLINGFVSTARRRLQSIPRCEAALIAVNKYGGAWGSPIGPASNGLAGRAGNVCFSKRPSDNEQRFDQHSQVGQVLDKLPDAGLEPHRPNHANLEAEVA
jgi:hypothetical protein